MKHNPELIRNLVSEPTLVQQIADEYRKWASAQKPEAVKNCVWCMKTALADQKVCIAHLHTH